MTSITWAGPRCVQELATFLGPQNRTQGRCDKKLALEQTKKIQELEKVVLSQKTEIQSICDKRDRISELEQKVESQYKEFGVTEKLSDILSSLGDMNKQIDKMESHFTLPKTASQIGEDGEIYVLNCLKTAFPNNTGIVRSGEKNCGDIFFRFENSEDILMVEVKNNLKGTVTGLNSGKDYQKFFDDLHNSPLNFSGGVLVSLNTPVDIKTPSREPYLDKGKPFVFVDNLRSYPDPACLLHVVITMMSFMIKHSKSNDNSIFITRLDCYKKQSDRLLKVYKDLLRHHSNQKKSLDAFQEEIRELKSLLSGE